jgi:hypothetical protein
MPVLSRVSGLPRYLNPLLRPIAVWAPPLAVIHHQGRKSGKRFDTPVQAFRTNNGFIVGLAYDTNANRALNLLAADGGELSRGGRRYALTQPRRRGPEARDDLPAIIAFAMRKLEIDQFLEFDATRI